MCLKLSQRVVERQSTCLKTLLLRANRGPSNNTRYVVKNVTPYYAPLLIADEKSSSESPLQKYLIEITTIRRDL
jgi:hypothetical protein